MKSCLFRLLCVLCGIALSGCASQRQTVVPSAIFVETEAGYRASLVPLVPDRARWGEAMVWSRGAFRERNGTRRPVIHVGVRVTNSSGAPLATNPSAARISVNPGEEDELPELQPDSAVRGETVIGAGESGEVALIFPLPDSFSPSQVDAFTFRWPIASVGETATVMARFVERLPYPRPGPYWWYEPYPYGWPYYYGPSPYYRPWRW